MSNELKQHTYMCFWKNKRIEVQAPTSYDAQVKAASLLKAKKSHEVVVFLHRKDDGEPVVHDGSEL